MVERLSRTDVLEYWYIETAVSLYWKSRTGIIGTSELLDRLLESPLLQMVR